MPSLSCRSRLGPRARRALPVEAGRTTEEVSAVSAATAVAAAEGLRCRRDLKSERGHSERRC